MMKLSHSNAEAPEKYWCITGHLCAREL